jgi:ATP-binding cassette subfamily B multidrug efflux pump
MRDFGYSEEGQTGGLGDFHLWRRIFRFAAPYRLGIVGAILISLLITWATLTLPYLLQHGIDNYITAVEIDRIDRLRGLGETAVKYGLLIVLTFLASFCQVFVLEWIGQSVMHSVRQNLFRHLLGLDLPFFSNNPTGRLVTRLTNDIQNMNEMFTSVIVTLFNDLLRLVGIIILLFWMNPRLAGVMTLFIPVALGVTVLFARLARERFRAIRTQLARINSYLAETIAGITILQLFGRALTSYQQFAGLSREYQQRTMSQIKLFGTFMPLTEFMSSAAVGLILWYGGGEVLQKRLTLGELVAFISYMRLFFQPLRELSQKYSIVQSAMASAERIFQLLDKRTSLMLADTPKEVPNARGKIRFVGVSFGYSRDTKILHDISFTLEPGKTVALVGTTGSGKTTIVNLLLRFYDPSEGTITLDDVDIRQLSLETLRRRIGVILQDVFILQDTLLANIVMDTNTPRREVETILTQTGMDRFVDKLPKGLDTPIGEGGIALSTGEKQLLSFARVLCRKPSVLILDEATAAIDTESENILEEAIATSFQDQTSLVIAHRLSTIRRADRILVMAHGRIIEEGSHEDLLSRQGAYAQLVAMDLHNSHQSVKANDFLTSDRP